MRHAVPNSFPAANTHRLVLFDEARQPSEFERLEDILASGLGALRRGLARTDLPTEYLAAVARPSQALREGALQKRRLLAEQTREELAWYLAEAGRWIDRNAETPEAEAARGDVAEALRISNRVADLVGAEKDIGWHRNLGG